MKLPFSKSQAHLIASLLSLLSASAGMAEIEITLSATTDGKQITPAFDCEEDSRMRFPFQPTNLPNVGQMESGLCKLPFSLESKELNILSLSASGAEEEKIPFLVDTVLGGIDGKALLEQTALFFDGQAMSYGVSHAAPPLTDQAYIYTGAARERWMESLQNDFPDLLIRDLVVPGAHDAGMYELNVQDVSGAVGRLCNAGEVLDAICALGGDVGIQLIENLAVNQKDTAFDQLRLGIRFFDFRPGVALHRSGVAHHIHNFIPGVAFGSFLKDVNRFLAQAKREVVFLRLSDDEIDTQLFEPLTQPQVMQALTANIDSSVGFTLIDSIVSLNQRSLAELAENGPRLVAIYGRDSVNRSYQDAAYSESLTDPSSVIAALETALGRCASSSYEYSTFFLQNTGQVALQHYKSEIVEHLPSWFNDLVLSSKGSLLQATKPLFDRGTYSWLVEQETLEAICRCNTPVILLNDFVDPALVATAEALSRHRVQQADDQNAAESQASNR